MSHESGKEDMPEKASGYKNLKELAAEGIYDLVDPLDFLILQKMHEEGEMSLGLYPLGDNVHSIRKQFTAEQQKVITTALISSRLRPMHIQELVSNTKAAFGSDGKRVWQRTKLGTKVLNEWENKNVSPRNAGKPSGNGGA